MHTNTQFSFLNLGLTTSDSNSGARFLRTGMFYINFTRNQMGKLLTKAKQQKAEKDFQRLNGWAEMLKTKN